MKKKKTIVYVFSLIVILLLVLTIWNIKKSQGWTYWAGDPLVYKEVVAIVWVRPEISEKKSYKKFIDVNEIKEILKQVATPKGGASSLKGKEKQELRIYFLNGENYYVPFAVEDNEFVGPNGRNKELFKILNEKQEAAPFWEDLTPEEVEKQGKLMEEVIKEKKKLQERGL